MQHFTIHYDSQISFLQRLHNHLVLGLEDLYQRLSAMPEYNKLMQAPYKAKDLPCVTKIMKNRALVFVNTHFS